jgi:hypothetical protein
MRKLFFTFFTMFIFFLTTKAQWTQLNNTRLQPKSTDTQKLQILSATVSKINLAKSDTLSLDETKNIIANKGLLNVDELTNHKTLLDNLDKITVLINKKDGDEDALAKVKEIEENRKVIASLKKDDKINKATIEKLNKLSNDLSKELAKSNSTILLYLRKTYKTNGDLFTLQSSDFSAKLKNYVSQFLKYAETAKNAEVFHKDLADLINKQNQITHDLLVEKVGQISADTINVKELFNQYKDAVKVYNNYGVFIERVDITSDLKWVQEFETISNNVINLQTAFAKEYDEVVERLTNNSNDYNEKVKSINKELEKVATKDKKIGDYDALANFTKILDDNGASVPGINILGNYTYGSANSVGGFAKWQLFTGLSGIKNSNTYFNLFVPEASTYGFNALFNLGFTAVSDKSKEVKKNIGIFLETNFLGKTVKLTDSLNANTFLIHTKLGAELIFLRNIFSIRGVINNINIGNQFNDIKKYKTGISSNIWFVNIGLSAVMELNEDKNFMLKFDLDIIPVKKDLEDYIGSEKKMIPQIKIGIIKKV